MHLVENERVPLDLLGGCLEINIDVFQTDPADMDSVYENRPNLSEKSLPLISQK